MFQKKISDDFFERVILRGQTGLYDQFSVAVTERKVGPDIFFEIVKPSNHSLLNSRIVKYVLSNIPVNDSACGFVEGKSYFDFLKPHVTGYYFLRLDIKSFFHSIPAKKVKDLLALYFNDDKRDRRYSSLDLAVMCTLHKLDSQHAESYIAGKEILPIGFSSSPTISNIIFRSVDILIQKFCENKSIVYSRYADDMLFSSSRSNYIHSDQFQKEISIFISTLSLHLKNRKRVAAQNTISLNGYVIQNSKPKKKTAFNPSPRIPIGNIRLSNKKLKVIKKLVHYLKVRKSPAFIMENLFFLNRDKFLSKYNNDVLFYDNYASDQLQNKLKGYRSYLIALIVFDLQHQCVNSECLVTSKKLVEVIESNIR